jgi:hypothetical protein
MPNDNRDEFARVCALLHTQGYAAIKPHHFINSGTAWPAAMRASISRMLDCEGVAMLDGWENSKGASLEHYIAEQVGLPCKPWREWTQDPAAAAQAYASAQAAALAG